MRLRMGAKSCPGMKAEKKIMGCVYIFLPPYSQQDFAVSTIHSPVGPHDNTHGKCSTMLHDSRLLWIHFPILVGVRKLHQRADLWEDSQRGFVSKINWMMLKYAWLTKWGLPEMGVPNTGWFISWKSHLQMDDEVKSGKIHSENRWWL